MHTTKLKNLSWSSRLNLDVNNRDLIISQVRPYCSNKGTKGGRYDAAPRYRFDRVIKFKWDIKF